MWRIPTLVNHFSCLVVFLGQFMLRLVYNVCTILETVLLYLIKAQATQIYE